MKEKSVLTIATTHYQELKKYALMTSGFENASVEFDVNKLSPTYKLLIGVPGKSYAFDISKKLGLANSIIENAKVLINKNDFDFEELLKNIHNDKIIIEQDKSRIESELEKITISRKLLDDELSRSKEKSKKILQDAKLEARNVLLQAKDDATAIIKEMNSIKNSSESEKDLNNYRNQLNQKIKEINVVSSDIKRSKNQNSNISKDVLIDSLVPNSSVFITTLNQEGTIISHVSKNNEVLVQVGSLKMNLPIDVLKPLNKSKKSVGNVSFSSVSKSRTATSEINVIGMNIEEATFVIDKFLDDSSLAKLNTVRIVHGKGTGKLRDGIHKFLKKNPHVKAFRMGTFGEGEMGVTVVELK